MPVMNFLAGSANALPCAMEVVLLKNRKNKKTVIEIVRIDLDLIKGRVDPGMILDKKMKAANPVLQMLIKPMAGLVIKRRYAWKKERELVFQPFQAKTTG